MVNPPSPLEKVTNEGSMIQRFMLWTQDITRAVNFMTIAEGTGSPEGVLSAKANKLYRDSAGALYWKSVDDVASDTTNGWLQIV